MIDDRLNQAIQAITKGYEAEEIFFNEFKRHFPSKSAVIDLIDDVRILLFPGYFDNDTAAGDSTDFLVGERLLHINRVLTTQVRTALLFDSADMPMDEDEKRAEEIADAFLKRLPVVQDLLLKDAQAAFDGDPAATSREEVILTYPGYYAIFVHRIAHELIKLNVPLYQGVTLGATSTRKGQLLRGVKRHPTLEDYVTVYSNASVLGGDTVLGRGAVIGGSAFVTESVPADARVYVKDQEVVINTPGTKEPAWRDCN